MTTFTNIDGTVLGCILHTHEKYNTYYYMSLENDQSTSFSYLKSYGSLYIVMTSSRSLLAGVDTSGPGTNVF